MPDRIGSDASFNPLALRSWNAMPEMLTDAVGDNVGSDVGFLIHVMS